METHKGEVMKDYDTICSRCGGKAEWMGIGDEDLCQECWEAHCSEEWWRLNVWQNGVGKVEIREEK